MKVINQRGDEMDHIDVLKFPEGCDEDLPKVKLGAFMESETRFLRPIKVRMKVGRKYLTIILCDSPGLKDSRGEELDVAN